LEEEEEEDEEEEERTNFLAYPNMQIKNKNRHRRHLTWCAWRVITNTSFRCAAVVSKATHAKSRVLVTCILLLFHVYQVKATHAKS
jgi:hypothetical protein